MVSSLTLTKHRPERGLNTNIMNNQILLIGGQKYKTSEIYGVFLQFDKDIQISLLEQAFNIVRGNSSFSKSECLAFAMCITRVKNEDDLWIY